MKIIVAADQNWGIGYQNKLLVKIPADMKRFQAMTINKVVIMGKNTFESLPGQAGLYSRKNLVITSDTDYKAKDADVVHTFKEAILYLQECIRAGYTADDFFVIGGEHVYRQFLPLCDTVYLTKLQYSYEADTYFPNLEQMPEWKLVDRSDEQTYFDIEYYFEEYRKTESK